MKKITNLLIGTNNDGKLREITALLPKYIKIYSTSVFNLKSPIEDGKTFEDNSIIKSKYFSKKTNLPCLADDSGLEIDILDKAPGIYSARWGGRNSDFNKAITRVFKELNKTKKDLDGFKNFSAQVVRHLSAPPEEPSVPETEEEPEKSDVKEDE